jgi:hypothetical protein
MTKPHKCEVNSAKSGSLRPFEFVFWTRNGQSQKIKCVLRVFFSEDFKFFFNICLDE